MSDHHRALAALAQQAWWTGVRLRIDAIIRRTALFLPLPLLYGLGVLTFIKVARPDAELEGYLVGGMAVPVGILLIAVVNAAIEKRPAHVGAMALDKHHGLKDRITSALTFQNRTDRTPLMDAAIEDAVAVARDLKPRKAAPVRIPRELAASVLLALAVVGISLLEVRTHRELPPEERFDPMVMSPDDLDLFRKMADELEEQSQDPDALAAIRKFNQLVEDIAQRRLDRTEVFRRMAELERNLMEGAEADREALDEGFKRMARELEKSPMTKPIAKPLEEKRLADAEKAMRELAEKLKKNRDKVTKQDLERLRKALRAASKSTEKWQKGVEQRRKELEKQRKRLLKKKNEKKLSKREKQDLAKKDRQLERLNREKKRADAAKRKLSKLDQELAKAAQDLMRDMGASAQDLEGAAEDINRMAKKEMSDQEKRDMLQRIKEMREVLRQQGKGGKERLQRMLRFGRSARGQKGGQGQGQRGQGQKGQGQQGQGQQGQGQQGQGQMPGQGQGQGQGETLVMGGGQGDKPVLMPGQGQGAGQGEMPGKGQGQGQGQGDKPGEGGGLGGKSWGTAHDENVRGEKTHLKGETKDVSAAGVDSGEGQASAEVIYGAAQRGFVGRGYQKVFTDYKTVAEDVMNRDEIPPGYRFYVRRYFQLIRPRD